MNRFLIWQGSMLFNPVTGEHIIWSHYSDGSEEVTYELRSPAIIYIPLRFL